jgi:hypothetical protein
MGMKALVGSALSRSVSSAVAMARDLFRDTVEESLRDVGRWVKGMALRYGIGAAIALTGLVLLGHGLAGLLAAAGLPGYAGYLIVAAVLGIAAAVLFKTGSARPTHRSTPHPDRGLTIRIVSSRRNGASTRRRTARVHRTGRRRGASRRVVFTSRIRTP